MEAAVSFEEKARVMELEQRQYRAEQLGLFQAGGLKPTGATLTLIEPGAKKGLTVTLDAGDVLVKGETYRFQGRMVVREVAQGDEEDREGAVEGCLQRHLAVVTDLKVKSD